MTASLNIGRCTAMAAMCLGVGGARAGDVDYVRDVKPVLKARCYACHSAVKQEAGLRLDTAAAVRRGSDNGQVIEPNDPPASPLLQRVASRDESERMPPEGRPLEDNQIALLRAWIVAGAPAPKDEVALSDPSQHWAFQPLRRVPLHSPPAGNPIDGFVEDRLRKNGLRGNSPADTVTLIRRMFHDMHGLPPTPEQVRQWSARLGDTTPAGMRTRRETVGELVDYLLASPRYGERWGQYWLDIVRYADTDGFEVNTPRPHAWPYRDYVIGAFNEDKPYDQFVLEQIAGDWCGEDAATGFLVAAAVLLPGQVGQDEASKRLARQDALDEIVVGTSATFLGLTLGCARCHDHKFDPFTMEDYYALQACFAGVAYGDREIHDAARARRRAAAAQLAPRVQKLERQVRREETQAAAGQTDSADNEHKSSIAPPGDGRTAELEALRKRKSELEEPRLVYAGVFREPDDIHVLHRGDPEQPLDRVAPGVPAALGSMNCPAPGDEQQRRVALASWIADPGNPLTARVLVNRIWQQHFGRGLVDTPSDFGLNGAAPSHPDLLDWMAAEFVRMGWSIKQLHRMVLTSDTYQRSAWIDPHAQQIDADCRWLWRYRSRRLEAEAIRDSILAVNGRLNLKMGGPGFNFFTTRGGLSGFPPLESFGPKQLRRMVYAHRVRMELVPVFGVFDCPDAGQATPRRSQSTTAVQALNLFNSPFVWEQTREFAVRVRREAGDGRRARISLAWQLAVGRSPSETELSASLQAVRAHGLASLCRALYNSNEFLFLP